jgi:hypothetical protein
MGARRETLGKIEEEWGTLMFFLNSHKKDRRCVFGPILTAGGPSLWLPRGRDDFHGVCGRSETRIRGPA